MSELVGEKLTDDRGRARSCAEILKALAHPLRLQIVAVLCSRGPQHVSGLSELLGAKQAVISQQLRPLRLRGLVTVQRDGGFAYYALAEPHLRQLVGCMESCAIRF